MEAKDSAVPSNSLWAEIKKVFTEALLLPRDQQDEYVRSAAKGDSELATEVFKLLTESAKDDDFLDRPFLDQIPNIASPDPRLGFSVGAYRLNRVIARGGSSTIYHATREDGLFEKDVAVKLATKGIEGSPSDEHLANEIRLLSCLDHRYVCRLIDAGLSSGELFAILEYAAGGRILDYCEEHRKNTRQKLDLFIQLCESVQYLHNSGLFHGDIKPGNALVRRDGSICLIDFGSSQRIGEQGVYSRSKSQNRPALTIGYASPELLSSESRVSHVSEVYSLGMILYELLSGSYPYSPGGTLLDQLIRSIHYDDPTPPSRVQKRSTFGNSLYNESGQPPYLRNFESALDDVTLMALQKNPADRYQSVSAFASDVNLILRGSRPFAASFMDSKRDGGSRLDKPLSVFLAHCREDKHSVRKIHSRLLDLGATPWLDEIDIVPGYVWRPAIDRALKAADVVLVCLSQVYVKKIGYSQSELENALKRAAEHPKDSIFIIPLRLEDCDIPEELKPYQWVDLFEDNGFARLANALRAKCSQLAQS
jgi:serine/threonine protein kinase